MNLSTYRAGCKLTSGHYMGGRWFCVYCKKDLIKCIMAKRRANENTIEQRPRPGSSTERKSK